MVTPPCPSLTQVIAAVVLSISTCVLSSWFDHYCIWCEARGPGEVDRLLDQQTDYARRESRVWPEPFMASAWVLPVRTQGSSRVD